MYSNSLGCQQTEVTSLSAFDTNSACSELVDPNVAQSMWGITDQVPGMKSL